MLSGVVILCGLLCLPLKAFRDSSVEADAAIYSVDEST